MIVCRRCLTVICTNGKNIIKTQIAERRIKGVRHPQHLKGQYKKRFSYFGVSASLCVVFFQGYEGVRESNKKSSALTVKSVDSNMNKKNKKKKDEEEEIELPSKKNQESSAPACLIHPPLCECLSSIF